MQEQGMHIYKSIYAQNQRKEQVIIMTNNKKDPFPLELDSLREWRKDYNYGLWKDRISPWIFEGSGAVSAPQ